jgi:hypothetical protein
LTQPTPNKGWKGIVEFGTEVGSLKDAGQLIAEIAEDDTSSIAWAQSGYDLLRPSRVQLSRYALAKARGSLICTPWHRKRPECCKTRVGKLCQTYHVGIRRAHKSVYWLEFAPDMRLDPSMQYLFKWIDDDGVFSASDVAKAYPTHEEGRGVQARQLGAKRLTIEGSPSHFAEDQFARPFVFNMKAVDANYDGSREYVQRLVLRYCCVPRNAISSPFNELTVRLSVLSSHLVIVLITVRRISSSS